MTMLEVTFEKKRHWWTRVNKSNENQEADKYVTKKVISFVFDKNDTPSERIETLKSLYEKNEQVTLGIPSEKVMIRDVELDTTLTDTEVMQFLISKSMEFFGHSGEKLCIDYKTVHSNEPHKYLKQKIIAIAAHKSFIQAIQIFFEQIEIPIDRITVSGNDIAFNLLPWRLAKAKKRKLVQFLTAVFLIALIFVFTLTIKSYFLHLTDKYIKKTMAIKQENDQIVLNHPHQHIALLQLLNSIHTEKRHVVQTNQVTENLLKTIANVMPNTITLHSLRLSAKTIQISGVSDQLSSIQSYSNALRQSLSWKKISITEIHNDLENKSAMDFTMRIMP